MNIPAKTEYACVAVLELAAHYGSGEPVPVRTIAGRHEIPDRFLVQILLQRKAAGLVASKRGSAGGYRLACPPAEVSLGQVMDGNQGLADRGMTRTARMGVFCGFAPLSPLLRHAKNLGKKHPCHLVQKYVRYYHTVRTHQALGNLPPDMARPPDDAGVLGPDDVESHEWLGGLLKHYERKAA